MSEQASGGNVPNWTIGDRLRKALDYADISVQDMADYLEVSRNTVSSYINDRGRAPGAVLKLWAMRTGVPLEWLRTGAEPAPPHSPDGGQGLGTCG